MQTSTLAVMFFAPCGRAVAKPGVEADDSLEVGTAPGHLERQRAAEAVTDGSDS